MTIVNLFARERHRDDSKEYGLNRHIETAFESIPHALGLHRRSVDWTPSLAC